MSAELLCLCFYEFFNCFFCFFFFKQKTADEIRLSLGGSEMCIRDRCYDKGNIIKRGGGFEEDG